MEENLLLSAVVDDVLQRSTDFQIYMYVNSKVCAVNIIDSEGSSPSENEPTLSPPRLPLHLGRVTPYDI